MLSLGGGLEIPALGLGVFQIPAGSETISAVRWALEAGYRHVDTAQAYGNEESVGRALGDSGVRREDVFVTTKFAPRRADPEAALEDSLRKLGLDHVDLYLVHNPMGGPARAWTGMESAHERGLARSIGVSNYDASELEAVCSRAEVAPLVNQIQLSPFTYRRELLAACERHGVAVEAYSPLTRGARLEHPTVAGMARGHDRTPAQVLLRWGLQHGFVVLPKSAHRERIEENARSFDFTLTADDMAELDALDTTGGTSRAVERKWWSGRARARAAGRRLIRRLRR